MHFTSQVDYEHYHAPAQRERRRVAARAVTDLAVETALRYFLSGDIAGARQTLFYAGLTDEGVSHYINAWKE